ncbi:uncharacterized protein LOC133044803 [Dama dama]|uniref:uncharacterized protein LOC133044803 n=1 Tax=Dama dama TaxID=30532 RepID=UPI002A36C701|nr:uncharacterized protein LOC133044803 [Dama dama]
MFFIFIRTWKQPRCPSADEWTRKLWYIYTMEYYSAIKKNSFEPVLMRWMKLEPLIQSEGCPCVDPSLWSLCAQGFGAELVLSSVSKGFCAQGLSPPYWAKRVPRRWSRTLRVGSRLVPLVVSVHPLTWKQPRCPSADEWTRKLWYIYTMEYYSAIKKNSFEPVLMRWMKREPLIQSEGCPCVDPSLWSLCAQGFGAELVLSRGCPPPTGPSESQDAGAEL